MDVSVYVGRYVWKTRAAVLEAHKYFLVLEYFYDCWYPVRVPFTYTMALWILNKQHDILVLLI